VRKKLTPGCSNRAQRVVLGLKEKKTQAPSPTKRRKRGNWGGFYQERGGSRDTSHRTKKV